LPRLVTMATEGNDGAGLVLRRPKHPRKRLPEQELPREARVRINRGRAGRYQASVCYRDLPAREIPHGGARGTHLGTVLPLRRRFGVLAR